MNKDFFIDTYQVYLARYYGADAILLMLSVLSDNEYKALAAVAEKYNLAILTEISNEEEKLRAIALGAKLIGINNRDLRDLSTDITRTFDYAPSIPKDRIVISESGIYSNDQIRELAPAVDGFLVGSSVMAEEDIDLACRKLIYGNNKVCGLTHAKHAEFASQSGAVYGGLIFAEKSPRFVTLEQAEKITTQVTSLNYVGVFVNHDINSIVANVKQLGLCAVQLHGEEDQQTINALRNLLNKNNQSNCQIWKAKSVKNTVPLLDLNAIEHYVLDGKNAGSGQPFNWQALTDTEQDLSACFLAGGLNGENIEQAVNLLTAHDLFGLDLNSGVEQSPGIKCSEKLQNIFAKIRNY